MAGDTNSATTRKIEGAGLAAAAPPLIVWGLAAAYAAAGGAFETAPGELPLLTITAALVPPLLFLAAYSRVEGLRDWVAGLDLGLVVATQAWRIIGAMFLAFWAVDLLPALFAFPAGVGDVFVGFAAPFAALAVWRKSPGWRGAAYGIIVAGMADFVVAIFAGVTTREGGLLHAAGSLTSSQIGVLPLSLFPTFIVPAFIILHLIAVLKLRRS